MDNSERYFEHLQDIYYRAKLRTIDYLRDASNSEHVDVEMVVIDQGRNSANLSENHIIKLLSKRNQQIVTIRHAVFIDEGLFYLHAAPMLREAIKRLAA